MTDDEIVLNRELLRAIGADTRIAILKALQERRKTQSELAAQLKLAGPTVLEHLQQLETTGLVEKMEEGRKWKYYRLTSSAERLLSRQRVHAVVMLAVGLIAVIGILVFVLQTTGSPAALVVAPAEATDIPTEETPLSESSSITSAEGAEFPTAGVVAPIIAPPPEPSRIGGIPSAEATVQEWNGSNETINGSG